MGLLERFRESRFSKMIHKVFGKNHAKIGIYGPPNVGKTTLANRILRDWTGDIMGSVSEVPHETRRAKWKNNMMTKTKNILIGCPIKRNVFRNHSTIKNKRGNVSAS